MSKTAAGTASQPATTRQHAGKWVAEAAGTIVAVAATFGGLRSALRNKGYESGHLPVVRQEPEETDGFTAL
jgi:hypothetical protein